MGNNVVDARGFSCPEPLLMVKRALEEGNFPLEVLVASYSARDNIVRFVQERGFQTRLEEKDSYTSITILGEE